MSLKIGTSQNSNNFATKLLESELPATEDWPESEPCIHITLYAMFFKSILFDFLENLRHHTLCPSKPKALYLFFLAKNLKHRTCCFQNLKHCTLRFSKLKASYLLFSKPKALYPILSKLKASYPMSFLLQNLKHCALKRCIQQ